VIVLYITTPYILMYSIEFSNKLTAELTKEQTITQFLQDVYTKAGEKANSVNEDAQFEETGIPTFKFSLTGGLLKGMGDFITKAFVFLLMLAAMLIGLIALAFQFTFRILALITLSILFPFAIPFALSEKTQGMVESFFKLWFSYLLQQPAFALGYAIVIAIARSALDQGFNIGLMFFFTASLFFLSVINDLVTRIFGDPWTAISSSMKSAFAGGLIGGAVGGSIGKIKEGVVGGRVSGIRNYVGNRIGQKYGLFPRTDTSEVTTSREGYRTQWIDGKPKTVQTQDTETVSRVSRNRSKRPFNQSVYQGGDTTSSGGSFSRSEDGGSYSGGNQSFKSEESAGSGEVTPRYTFMNDFNKKGWETTVDDEKLGVVKMSGEAYSYHDKASGLTSIYSSKQDAIRDGALESDLKPYSVKGGRYIDLSTFGKNRKNPHNSYATSVARKKGFKSDYAHIKHSSDPERIKKFFEMTNSRNKKLGIDGVIVRRWGNMGDSKTKDKVVRIYTTKNI
jgi:predicted lipid-binding transport protein (Tim44 family)